MEVALKGVRTFAETVNLAERLDSIIFGISQKARTFDKTSQASSIESSNADAMDLDAIETSRGTLYKESRIALVKSGKCLYCREKGHINCFTCP